MCAPAPAGSAIFSSPRTILRGRLQTAGRGGTSYPGKGKDVLKLGMKAMPSFTTLLVLGSD
jgi:hypothetical protein